MRKEDFVKLGIDEELAEKCANASAEELKGFIPKSRFDEVNNDKKHLDSLLKERDEQLEELKKTAVGSDDLKKQIEDLQNANAKKDAEHLAEINKLKLDSAIESALAGANVKNSKAVKALLNLDGAELLDDGSVKGLTEQLSALKETDDYLFESKSSKIKGAKIGQSGVDDDNPPDLSKMSYEEIADYMSKHPEDNI